MNLLIQNLVKECGVSELREKLDNIRKDLSYNEFIDFLHFKESFPSEGLDEFKYNVPPVIFYKFCTIDKIEVLLDFGLDINSCNEYGKNALFYVDAEKCDFLIKKGIEKQNFPYNGMVSPLFNANIEKLKLLLSHGYDINVRNKIGQNLMFYAPSIDVVDFLLKNGFSINETDNYGNNIIMNDFENNQIIKDLIKRGLDINHLNNRKCNALFNTSLEKLEVLLEYNVDVHQISITGSNCAFDNSYSGGSDEKKLVKKLKLLKKAGVDFNIIDKRGKNIFHYVSSPLEIEFLILEGVKLPEYNLETSDSREIKKFNMFDEVKRKIAIDKERGTILNTIGVESKNDVVKKRRI